jgi:hypothetical protein
LQSPMAEIQSETVSITTLVWTAHYKSKANVCKEKNWEELFTCIQSILRYGAKT